MPARSFFVICATAATFAFCTSAAAAPAKDVTYFLHRMHTLDHLPELEECLTGVTGSWDRMDANWDAIDYHNLQGTRNIMLDVDGPGCVTKILEGTLNDYGVPQAYGTIEGTDIRIYLDHNPIPVFDTPLIQFLDPDKGPFPNPLTWNPKNGQTFPGVVFPIPYAKHCRIELYNPEAKHWGSYWNITYLTYPKDTRVKTFTWPLSPREKSEMDAVCKAWLKAPTTPPRPAEEVVEGPGADSPRRRE